jgi:hypothetical protein
MQKKDADDNNIFKKVDLYGLHDVVIRTLGLRFSAAAATADAQPDAQQTDAEAAHTEAAADKAQPATASTFQTPDKAEQRTNKRQKV